MRIRALILRIVKQFFHDKRSLAMMLLAPLLILFLMKLVFDGAAYHPKIATVGMPSQTDAALQHNGAELSRFAALKQAESRLVKHKLDAVLYMKAGMPALELEGSDPSVNRSIQMMLQHTLAVGAPASPSHLHVTYLHGSKNMKTFDNIGPVLIGVFAFFFVFILAGVAFLRERTGGTLERLLASPIRRWEIVVGYVSGFGIFTMLQAVLIAAFSISLLGMMMAGSYWFVLLITLLLALTALTLGTLLSAFADNEFQMIQFIPLVIVPQIFFSGLFNLNTISEWIRWLHYAMPLYYGADALREVMIRGGGWSRIQGDVLVLLAISLLFMLANVRALRRYRKL